METSRRLHEVIIGKTVVVLVVVVVDLVVPVGIEGDLGLSSLALLVALVSRTLLAHLLVASGGEGASNLLDFGTGELLDKPAGEILSPEGVLGLLRLRSKEGNENVAQPGELVLGGGLEQGHGRQVDRVGGVFAVGNDDSLGGTAVAVQVDVADQIGGVLQIGLLLGAAQAITALGLSLVRVVVVAVLSLLPPLLTMLFYPLRLGLFIRGRGSLGLGLSLGGLLRLLALYLRVLGCIPRVKNLLLAKRVH